MTGTSHNYYDSNAGGLVGSGCSTITNSYAMGNVTSTSRHNSCVGGLVGYGDGMNTTIIMDSYAMGNVTSIGHDNSRAGGLVGGTFLLTVHNSYSVSRVSAESKNGNVCIGGLVGYIDNTAPLENAHWYGGEETAAEYAIGYSETLGISTSRGSTRHNSVEEFYTLVDALNAGREEPVWEHKGEDTLPTLIVRTDENQQ